MTEEQLKKLHTAMQNDNEHQCNKLYNYIHTDVFLTAEVVQVVREIVAEETKELQEENLKLEAQIEKMKCCGNCAKNGHICVAEEMQGKLCGKNKDKWELRR